MITQEILNDGIASYLMPLKKKYPCHVNRISSIGHPCERFLYYKRAAWSQAPDISDGLQGIFETGHLLEPQIQVVITQVGLVSCPRWRVVGSQAPTMDALLEKYNIYGSIDGFLQVETAPNAWKTLGVLDIKTSNPNIFGNLNTFEDLARYPWTRKYVGQLSLYALGHNLEDCYILFVNKANLFDMKLIHFPLDMAYAESLLQKAERVNKAVETETPPEKINQPSECSRCDFASLCMPELQTGGEMVMAGEEAAEMLETMMSLEEYKKEYDRLSKRLFGGILVKGKDAIVGNYIVTWTKTIREKSVRTIEAGEIWRKKIIKAN